MRLFVAVDLDDDARREVASLIARLRSNLGNDRSWRVSWVAPQRLHLTLHFLGNLNNETAARLAEHIAAPIDRPAFQVAFGDLGTFSSRGRPNVIWLGVAEGRASLIELHAIVGKRLKAVGCPLDERPFSPHLTLARLRQTFGTGPKRHTKRDLSSILQRTDQRFGPTLVDRVTLYESQLGRERATHTAVATGLLDTRRISS